MATSSAIVRAGRFMEALKPWIKIALAVSTAAALCQIPAAAVPVLSIGDAQRFEGDSGSFQMVFTAALSEPALSPVSFNFSTSPLTAAAGSDYLPAAGVVEIPAGATSHSISVTILGDIATEADETFEVVLFNLVNASAGKIRGTGTLQNDDPLPAIGIADVAIEEGLEGTTNAVFVVSLARPSAAWISVNYFTASGTATPGSDFAGVSGTLMIPPGATNASLTVLFMGDALNESDETLFVNLFSPVNATLADNQATGTIINDDPLPLLAIADVALVEEDTGNVQAEFTARLSAPSGRTVSVKWATANGSAQAGADYQAGSGTFTFAPGSINQSMVVTVNSDLLDEDNETFFVNLTIPSNVALPDAQAVCTIQDNDPEPTLQIEDAAVLEGDSGTTSLVLNVKLSAPSGKVVTVSYATEPVSALPGADYTPASGVLNFPPGSVTLPIPIAVQGDVQFEPAETLIVRLSNPQNATLQRATATGTILENESLTLLFTNAAPVSLPLVDLVNPYPSVISLSGVPGRVSRVAVTLFGLTHSHPDDLDLLLVGPQGQKVVLMSDTGGSTAVSGINLTLDDRGASTLSDSGPLASGQFRPADYAPADSWPAPAPGGVASANFNGLLGTDPNGDWSLFAHDDTFGGIGEIKGGWRMLVTVTNLVCCAGESDADLSITVTDSPDPGLDGYPATYTLVVVNGGPAAATGVAVTSLLPAGVLFQSAGVSTGTWNLAEGTLGWTIGSMAAGQSARLTVTVVPPATGTLTHVATVRADQPDLAPGNNTATAVTRVNLAPPTVFVNDVALTEPNITSAEAVFNVTLSRTNAQEVRIGYSTANDTALAGQDYVATSGILIFKPGTTNQSVAVTVYGDFDAEPDERFLLVLTNAPNVILSRNVAMATILNNDDVPGQVDRFVWDPVDPFQYQLAPFPVTLRAVDVNGIPVTDFAGPVNLQGLVGPATTKSLLVTEVDPNNRRVELVNVTRIPFDLTGWQVDLYDWVSWPDPKVRFTFPEGTVCASGDVVVLNPNGTYPGIYPQLYLGASLGWWTDVTTNQIAVAIRDASGHLVDFVCAVDAEAARISYPSPIPTAEWSGDPVEAIVDTTLSYQRVGTSDHNTAADWVWRTAGVGQANAQFTIPFPSPALVSMSPAVTPNFESGVWSGLVTIGQVATNMVLKATDLSGVSGFSGSFTIIPATDLSVTSTGPVNLVPLGSAGVYTMTISNAGPLTAAAVIVTNSFSASVTFLSATATQGSYARLGNSVRYSLGSLPAASTATLTLQLRLDTPGVFTNQAFVTSSTVEYNLGNNSATIVTPVNHTPVIAPLADVITREDVTTPSLEISISDVETPAGNLLVTASSSNPDLLPAGIIVLGGSGANRTMTLIPWPNRFGVSTNTITVSDGMASASRQFVLTVTPVNDAPALAQQTDRTINELTTLSVANGATDVDGDALLYQLIEAPQGATISPTGMITWPPGEAQGPSTNRIITVVRDNGSPNLSSTNSFVVTVNEVNLSPAINMPGTVTVNETTAMTRQATASDPDLPANTLTFSLVSGPADLTVTAAGLVSWTPPKGFLPGTNTVTLRVADSGVPSLSATGAFTVIVNHLPVPATPVVTRFGVTSAKVPLSDVLGSDPDNDALSLYFLDDISAQAGNVFSDGGWIFYEPPPAVASSDFISFAISDSRGGIVQAQAEVRRLPDESKGVVDRKVPLPGGATQVFFSGIPGMHYTIEATDNVTVPLWQTAGSAIADGGGIVIFVDSSPGGSTRLYRLAVPNQK